MKFRLTALTLLAAILLAACLSSPEGSSPQTPTLRPAQGGASGGLRVLATTTFLADIAQNVAGQRVEVASLIPVGVDPHEYQLTPQDTTRISQSRVLIANGVGYETWLQKTLDSVGGQRVEVIASTGLTPHPVTSGGHPEGDPHLWLDPNNVIQYVENIRDGLTQADPAGASVYKANAAAYIKQLKSLDTWITEQVNQVPPEKRMLVTNHEAFGYFAARYGFKIIGTIIPSLSTEASPSAQQMAALIDQIKATKAPAIFVEVGVNTNMAEQIASETGTKVVSDLYLETLSAKNGPAPDYISMMKYDVTQIVEALK